MSVRFSARFHFVIRILFVPSYPRARTHAPAYVRVSDIRYRLLFSLKNMKYKTAQLFRFCFDDTQREFNSIDVKTQRKLAICNLTFSYYSPRAREFQYIFLPDVEFYLTLLRSEILMSPISRTSLLMYNTCIYIYV